VEDKLRKKSHVVVPNAGKESHEQVISEIRRQQLKTQTFREIREKIRTHLPEEVDKPRRNEAQTQVYFMTHSHSSVKDQVAFERDLLPLVALQESAQTQ